MPWLSLYAAAMTKLGDLPENRRLHVAIFILSRVYNRGWHKRG